MDRTVNRRPDTAGSLRRPDTGAPVEDLGDRESGGVRWPLTLATGLLVGLLVQALTYPVVFLYTFAEWLFDLGISPERFGSAVGVWGLPLTHMALVALAAFWVARRSGAAPLLQGLLVALVSVLAGQVFALVYGPLYPDEVAKYLVLALAGGFLGGTEARRTLAGREALYRVSRAVGAARRPQEVADALGNIPLSSQMEAVGLWWKNSGEGGDLSSWVSKSWPSGPRLAETAPAATGTTSPRTLRTGDLAAEERAAWEQRGVNAFLLLPLAAPGRAGAGVLAVASRARRFTRDTVRAYETVGAQAALALENLRLVEEARKAGRQAGVLRERQRMAHEIHDTLAQGFTSIVMNLEAAESLTPPDATELGQYLDRVQNTARESLSEARRLVWALRPERLEEASLSGALEDLARSWSEESGVAASVTATGTPRPLAEEAEAALFRVAQEALSNIRKHARAGRAMLTLTYMGGRVVLDVVDDGAGFDPEKKSRKDRKRGEGFGLEGMRERVEELGGSFSVESTPGRGTRLAAVLPGTLAAGRDAGAAYPGEIS